MNEQIPAVQPPSRADGPPARPSKDGEAPPGLFAGVLGAAETATQPAHGEGPARTAHAGGTKAEGDSCGHKHQPSPGSAVGDATSPATAPAPSLLAGIAARQGAVPGRQEIGGPVISDAAGHAPGHGRPAGGKLQSTVPIAPGAGARPAAPTTRLQPNVAQPTASATPVAQGEPTAAAAAPSTQAAVAATAAPAPPAGRDGTVKSPAPPISKDGGHRVRPVHAGHRLGHTPMQAIKDAVERPLRTFARRGSAASHQPPPQAAPATAGSGQPPAAVAAAHRTSGSAAPAQTRPRPQLRTHELAESMHTLVRVANRRGTAAARITLRPAELGGIQVQLRSHAGGVSAALTAETRAGAQALGVSQGELRRSLEAQGILVHTIDVQLAGDGMGADGQSKGWQSPAQQAGAGVTSDDDGDSETTIEPSQLPDSGSQVDVLA